MLSMKIFFQILLVWQENDLVFSYEIALKQQHNNNNNTMTIAPCPPPPPPTHTHIKIQHAKGSINGSQEKGAHIFYKTIKLE